MEELAILIERLEALKTALPELVVQVLEENRAFIVELNLIQLNDGLRSDGFEQDHYSPVSVAKFGKPAGPMLMFDTGAYYRGMMAEINPIAQTLELQSSDSKNKMLETKYGPLGGLTEESEDRLKEEKLLPQLIEKTEIFLTAGL